MPADMDSIDVLDLSTRSYNCLCRSGISTVSQLVSLSDKDLLLIRNLGAKCLAEIREKLRTYLAEHPFKSSAAPEPDPPDVGEFAEYESPPEPFSACLDPTPLDVLGLSLRPYNALMRQGITTIGDLASMSLEQILMVRNVGRKSLAEIKSKLDAYLTRSAHTEIPGPVVEPHPPSPVPPRPDAEGRTAITGEQTLAKRVERLLAPLRERQRLILRSRYGLDGEALTLEQLGERLGVTRERVRQIQQRALVALQRYRWNSVADSLISLMVDLTSRAGGLISGAQIEATLCHEMCVGDIDPVSAARLISCLTAELKWLDKIDALGLTRWPLALIPAISRKLEAVLAARYAPTPIEDVLYAFKDTSIYQKYRAELKDDFILACLRAHPQIDIDDGDLCSLKKWSDHRLDEIVLALREVGEPEHYSVIAKRVNALLPPDQRTTPHNILAELGRRADLFVRVGRGVFGLREWGLPDDGCLANAAHRVLSEAGEPLHIEVITDRVLETWRAGRPSVLAAVLNDDRFHRVAPAVFGLIEWEIEKLSEKRPVLNLCPPPLPDRLGERNTFFESVLVARVVLRQRPTTAAFLKAMLEWVGTDPDKSERYAQNVLNAYYVVGLIPYTVYRRAIHTPLHSTLLETDDLQALRRFCLNRMMKRLARMPEFMAILAARQPCTRAELRDWFCGPGSVIDDVKNRVRLLYSLGALRKSAPGRYALAPLGEESIQQLRSIGRLKEPVQRASRQVMEKSQIMRDVEYDVIDFDL